MIDGFDSLLEIGDQSGLVELRVLLADLLGGSDAVCSLIDKQQLQSRRPHVFRLRFDYNGEVRSLVVKRLDPCVARRNELVIHRWLPAIGLGKSGPVLLGVAAERNGKCVWHVYQDLGDWALDASDPDPS